MIQIGDLYLKLEQPFFKFGLILDHLLGDIFYLQLLLVLSLLIRT